MPLAAESLTSKADWNALIFGASFWHGLFISAIGCISFAWHIFLEFEWVNELGFNFPPTTRYWNLKKKKQQLFLLQHMRKNDASVFSQCVNHGFSRRFLDTLVWDCRCFRPFSLRQKRKNALYLELCKWNYQILIAELNLFSSKLLFQNEQKHSSYKSQSILGRHSYLHNIQVMKAKRKVNFNIF